MTTPIERCLDAWHGYLRSKDPEALDALLADDVTFWSPIVFTPQQGKDLTKLYLTAAAGTLGVASGSQGSADPGGGGFRYVRKIHQGNDALLEFETTMDGKYVNGIDLITCNDDARIVDFKVMIRPLQAINLVHAQMKAMLESLNAAR